MRGWQRKILQLKLAVVDEAREGAVVSPQLSNSLVMDMHNLPVWQSVCLEVVERQSVHLSRAANLPISRLVKGVPAMQPEDSPRA